MIKLDFDYVKWYGADADLRLADTHVSAKSLWNRAALASSHIEINPRQIH